MNIERMHLAGTKMANTMFNLAQQEGKVIDARLVELMKRMQIEWDAAVRAAPADLDAELLPPLENDDLTWAIAGKVGEFYPQETPRDMEKNHRLARAIQRLPLLKSGLREAIAADRRKRALQELTSNHERAKKR